MSEILTVNDTDAAVEKDNPALQAIEQLLIEEKFNEAIDAILKTDKSAMSVADTVLLNHYHGVALFRLNRSSEALLRLKKSLDLAISIDDLLGVARANEEIGGVLHHESHFNEAEERLQQALKIYARLDNKEGVGRSHRNLGNLYVDMNETESSLKEFDKSRAIFRELNLPLEMAPAIIHKASVLYQSQGLLQSIEAYRVGIEEDKCDHYLVHNNYGFLLLLQAKIDEGLVHLERSLQLMQDENVSDDDLALVYLNMGVSYAIKQNLTKAEEFLRKAITILENYPDARAVELLLQANDKYRDKDFKPFLIVDNGQKLSLAHLNLGTVLTWAGRLDEAKAEVDKGIDLDRSCGYPYLSAGWVYLAQGDEKAAGVAFHRACGTEPNNVEFRKALELVNPYIGSKVGRNEPCPCGSGKKFKKCHGIA